MLHWWGVHKSVQSELNTICGEERFSCITKGIFPAVWLQGIRCWYRILEGVPMFWEDSGCSGQDYVGGWVPSGAVLRWCNPQVADLLGDDYVMGQ